MTTLSRREIVLLCLAILLPAMGMPLCHMGQESAAREAQRIAAATAKVEESRRQLQTNIATARELAGKLSEDEVARLLTPIDRLQAAGALERLATQSRFTHFTYTLGAERKDVPVVTGEASPGLVLSEITVAADAPLDTDVYAFLQGLQTSLPGRLRVAQLSLERMGGRRQPVAAANIHFEARLDWLSNGSASTLAGGL